MVKGVVSVVERAISEVEDVVRVRVALLLLLRVMAVVVVRVGIIAVVVVVGLRLVLRKKVVALLLLSLKGTRGVVTKRALLPRWGLT